MNIYAVVCCAPGAARCRVADRSYFKLSEIVGTYLRIEIVPLAARVIDRGPGQEAAFVAVSFLSSRQASGADFASRVRTFPRTSSIASCISFGTISRVTMAVSANTRKNSGTR